MVVLCAPLSCLWALQADEVGAFCQHLTVSAMYDSVLSEDKVEVWQNVCDFIGSKRGPLAEVCSSQCLLLVRCSKAEGASSLLQPKAADLEESCNHFPLSVSCCSIRCCLDACMRVQGRDG